MIARFAPQRLPRDLVCYRIGDPNGEFPIYDARGSALSPGRWNHSAMLLVPSYVARIQVPDWCKPIVQAASSCITIGHYRPF